MDLRRTEMRALSLMYGQMAAKEVDGDEMEMEPQASHSEAAWVEDLTWPGLGLIRHDTPVFLQFQTTYQTYLGC